jgi:lysozyme
MKNFVFVAFFLSSIFVVPRSFAGPDTHSSSKSVPSEDLSPPRMKISLDTLTLLKEFEGFRSTAYLCQANHLTIGYGHRCDGAACKFDCSKAISKDAAEDLLKCDVTRAERIVQENFSELKQSEFDALVSFTFNLGDRFTNSYPNLNKSILRFNKAKSVEERQTAKIDLAEALVLFTKADGRDLDGLKFRRGKEAQLLLTGEIPKNQTEAMKTYKELRAN